MEFSIPPADSLKRYTVVALRDLALEASAEFDSMKTRLGADPAAASDEELDHLEDLNAFMLQVDEELDNRRNREKRFAALPANAAFNLDKDETDPDEDEDADNGEKIDEKADKKAKDAEKDFAVDDKLPSVVEITKDAPLVGEIVETKGREHQFTMIAAPDTGFAAGQELEDWKAVATAFVNRTRSYKGLSTAQQHNVALIQRDFDSEFAMLDSDSDEDLQRKFDIIRDEKRLEGGSLVAGVGWCAPSETIYTTCSQITISGILSLPEIGARRGGIRHNQGIQFDSVFGDGTGYNILTEAQVIADTVKTCVAIPCPAFVDDRLKVAVLCLTGDILQNRAYPEFVSTFVQAAIATQAHNVNRQIIADIVADSTAVSLAGEPFLSDGSVVSQVMSGFDVASLDIKYRLRLEPGATIQVVAPIWLKGQMRADWIRRNGPMDPNLVDGMIDAMARARGVAIDWVYDWQDAFSGVSGGMGADTAVTALPTALQFLAFPAGTWVVARQDVIRLDSIYDSTNITTNKVTQLFLEDGFRAMRFCPVSRVYSMTICPSGATGAQRTVDCVTP